MDSSGNATSYKFPGATTETLTVSILPKLFSGNLLKVGIPNVVLWDSGEKHEAATNPVQI